MIELWKPLGRHAKISNMGRVIRIRDQYEYRPYLMHNRYYVAIQKGVNKKVYNIAREVLKRFKTLPTKQNCVSNHIDWDIANNKDVNLNWKPRGYARRLNALKRGKTKGVSRWKAEGKNTKWRAVISEAGKIKTLGYFKLRREAKACYNQYVGAKYL